jgi:hypothetical protein
MNRHRMTLMLGGAAGGLLAAGLLSTAVASAVPGPPDMPPAPPIPGPGPFTPPPFALPPPFGPGPPPIEPPPFPIPPGGELPAPGLTNIFGFAPIGPEQVFKDVGTAPFFKDVEGFQEFQSVYPQPGFPTGGVFLGDEETLTTPFFTTTDVVVDRDFPGGVAPPVGSVFDVTNFGAGYENIYEQIGSGPGAPIEDVLITPYGEFPLTSEPPVFLDTGFDPGSLPDPII